MRSERVQEKLEKAHAELEKALSDGVADKFAGNTPEALDKAAKRAAIKCDGILRGMLVANLTASGVKDITKGLRARLNAATIRARFDGRKGRVRIFEVLPYDDSPKPKNVKPGNIYSREVGLSYGFVRSSTKMTRNTKRALKKANAKRLAASGSVSTQGAVIVKARPYLKLEDAQRARIAAEFTKYFNQALSEEMNHGR